MGLRPRILKIPKEEDPIVQNSIDIELAVEKSRQDERKDIIKEIEKFSKEVKNAVKSLEGDWIPTESLLDKLKKELKR